MLIVQTVTIPPGSRGMDFTLEGWLGAQDKFEAYIKANGITFICVYIAPGNKKGATTELIQWAFKLGLAVSFIKENTINDMDGGYAKGVALAAKAKADLLAFVPQYPPKVGLPVTMCIDKDVTIANSDTAVSFMNGGGDTLEPEYALAGYIDWDAIKALRKAGRKLAMACVPGAKGWSIGFFTLLRLHLPFGEEVHMVQGFPPRDTGLYGRIDTLVTFLPVTMWFPHVVDEGKPRPPHELPILKYSWFPGSPERQNYVKWVQGLLHIKQDGLFRSQTKAAVVAFQKRHHLFVDGVVGPQTWAAFQRGDR